MQRSTGNDTAIQQICAQALVGHSGTVGLTARISVLMPDACEIQCD